MAVYFPNVPLSSTPGDALLNAGVLLDAGPRYYSDPQQLRMPLGSGVYGWLQDDIDAVSVQAQAPAAPTATSAGPDAGGVVLPEFPDVVSALDLSPLNNALYELSTALQEQREVAQLGDLSGTLDQLNVIVNDRGATPGQRVVVLQQALQTGTPLGAGGGGGGIGGGFGVSSAHNLLGWPHIDTVAVALAAGDMIYRSATDWVVLAAGVNHQLLEFNGPGSAPAWTSTPVVTTLETTGRVGIGTVPPAGDTWMHFKADGGSIIIHMENIGGGTTETADVVIFDQPNSGTVTYSTGLRCSNEATPKLGLYPGEGDDNWTTQQTITRLSSLAADWEYTGGDTVHKAELNGDMLALAEKINEIIDMLHHINAITTT